MDFDIVSALIGAAVPIFVGAFAKFAPKLAKKTDNKVDDAIVAAAVDWLEDPANQHLIIEKAEKLLNRK